MIWTIIPKIGRRSGWTGRSKPTNAKESQAQFCPISRHRKKIDITRHRCAVRGKTGCAQPPYLPKQISTTRNNGAI